MTVFEFLSSSKENMANFVCDRAVIPPCDLVCCNTPCNAIDGFNKTARDICMNNILELLSREIDADG